MGSSALGATRFRKRVKDAGLNIDVCNSPVDNIPSDADIVVCQKVLADRTLKNIRIVVADGFEPPTLCL